MPLRRGWLGPAFLDPETILLLLRRGWQGLVRLDPKVVRGAHSNPDSARPSNSERVLLVAVLVAADLEVQVAPGVRVVLEALVVPVEADPVLVVAGADPEEELREHSAVVARRASLASQSGRNDKNLKCGRRRV